MKIISTKNLYLCELRKIIKEEYNILTTATKIYYADEKKYVFAIKSRPWTYDKFTDVFTGTVYLKYDNGELSCGEWCVRESTPVITDHKFVSLSILSQALRELNPTFFKPIKNDNVVSKKLENVKRKILKK